MYGTFGSCDCGARFRSNSAPSKGGQRDVERSHKKHLEAVAGWPAGHELVGHPQRVDDPEARQNSYELACACGEMFATTQPSSAGGRSNLEAAHAAHLVEVCA